MCATNNETNETVCLTSYSTPHGDNELLKSVTIWQACQATFASFDPTVVGRSLEGSVIGATGVNNPVRELWDQAQLVWGLKGRVKCLVSIGTGVTSLTETEQTVERYLPEWGLLDSTGRYYRFNVVGLKEANKVNVMAAVTRSYLNSNITSEQIQACADSLRVLV